MDQKELTAKVVLNKIGKCPVCGKGQMLQGSAGWTCDYFKSLADKCTFTIFSAYQGYTLNEEDALEIIQKGKTGIRMFRTMAGRNFEGRLILEGNKVRVVAENKALGVPCPLCGKKVRETPKGYACENFFREGKEHCGTWIPNEICGRPITIQEAETILERGRTEVLDGFRTSQGKLFSTCLVMGADGNTRMDGRICVCPKCGGTLYAGIKGYNCSNYREEGIHCNFVVWRTIFGRTISVEDVRMLCSQRKTGIMEFHTKDGTPMQRALLLTDDYQVKLV